MFGAHRRRSRHRRWTFLASAVVAAGLVVPAMTPDPSPPIPDTAPSTTLAALPPETAAVVTTTQPPTTTTSTTTTTTVPPSSFEATTLIGEPWGTTVGVTMFRGNASRTWYGTGPLPTDAPEVLWRYPDSPMCGDSTVSGETTTWCGTGWTGQPIIWERPDGVTELIVGAYDHAVHFVDTATGEPTRAPFPTGDLIKGTVTLDPNGYPLLYVGSRDNKLRALALDRDPVEEVWAIDSRDHPGIWNNDWDSNPLVVEGLLLEGGENGYFFAFELNRSYDEDGLVLLAPELVAKIPTWDPALIAAIGDRNASVESSIVVHGTTAYVTNSGGRVLGIDLTRLGDEEPPIVFDFWTGDDTDATPVVDADGYLYVAVELERRTDRALELGQILKLDPLGRGPEVVWSVPVPPRNDVGDGGVWATPALGDGVLYVSTHPGMLLAIDTETGEVTWVDEIGFHAWSSPVIVDDRLLVAVDCELGGALRVYDLTYPRTPTSEWHASLGSGCIESTPVVWNGVIYVGSRDGYLRAWG